MGLNLSLIIEHPAYQIEPVLGYDRLTVTTQNRELFETLRAEALQLPQELYAYLDEGLTKTRSDPYGNPLTYTEASTLARLFFTVMLGPRDEAVAEFLKALPGDTRVVLWWH